MQKREDDNMMEQRGLIYSRKRHRRGDWRLEVTSAEAKIVYLKTKRVASHIVRNCKNEE